MGGIDGREYAAVQKDILSFEAREQLGAEIFNINARPGER